MTVKELFPGLMGMAIFFTSTAVGPAILPWEARSKTLERLVSSPVEVWALLLGDVFASFVFGLLISIMPLAVAVLMGVEVVHLLVFCLGMILATIC
ncbi:MAG TPA: ABC transporter permease, partial [Methanothrix sp.]|nr:ABC transporter permease [Methanothrix sp.]